MMRTTSEMIAELRDTYIEKGDQFIVLLYRKEDRTTICTFDLDDAMKPDKLNAIIDDIRAHGDVEMVAFFAFTPDKQKGTEALEIYAANCCVWRIWDAVWTDGFSHGHWGGLGEIHSND